MRFRIALLVALLMASLGLPQLVTAQLDPTCGPFTSTRLRLRKLDYPLGGQRLLFRGVMQIPAAALVDPASTGLRFRMTDDAGSVMSDVTLPGGAPTATAPGWIASGPHGSSYTDRQGTRGGLRRVLFRRNPSRPTDTKVLFFGQDMTFEPPVRDVYVHVYVVDDAGATICGGRRFRETDCDYRNLGGKLNCR